MYKREMTALTKSSAFMSMPRCRSSYTIATCKRRKKTSIVGVDRALRCQECMSMLQNAYPAIPGCNMQQVGLEDTAILNLLGIRVQVLLDGLHVSSGYKSTSFRHKAMG